MCCKSLNTIQLNRVKIYLSQTTKLAKTCTSYSKMLNANDFDDQQYHYNSVYNLTYTLKSKWSWLQIDGPCCQLCSLHIQRSQCDPPFSVVRCVWCSRCRWKCLTPESYCLPANLYLSNISYYGYSNRFYLPILSISNTNLGFYLGPFRLQHNPVPEYHLHL